MMLIMKHFFGPEDASTACGMFTAAHIISLVICLALVAVCVALSLKLSDGGIKRITVIIAVFVTVTEIIKIIYKISYSYVYPLDLILPISYCSLFIYSTWMCAYGKGLVYRAGASFITGGCIVGGLAFLIVPATSLMMHPIYHYLSIHSMLFHSSMVYLGIIYLYRGIVRLDMRSFKVYSVYVLITCAVAIILNVSTGSNLMLLTFPVNIPIAIIDQLASSFPYLYTLCAIAVYLFMPYLVAALIQKIIKGRNACENI